jgi:hypothetical protein
MLTAEECSIKVGNPQTVKNMEGTSTFYVILGASKVTQIKHHTVDLQMLVTAYKI